MPKINSINNRSQDFTIGHNSDPYAQFNSGSPRRTIGIDWTSIYAYKFNMTDGNDVTFGPFFSCYIDGELSYPRNTAFLGYQGQTFNVTGDYTAYNCRGTTLFSQGSGYNTTTGVFTASASACYFFSFHSGFESLSAVYDTALSKLISSNKTYELNAVDIGAIRQPNVNYGTMSGSCTAYMDAGDTATFTIEIGGGTKEVDTHLGFVQLYCSLVC